MYCPKCKEKYTDGSQKCKKCNIRLVVKLPKEKNIKKIDYGIHIENSKKKIDEEIIDRIEILFHIIITIEILGEMLLYFFGFNLLVNTYGKQSAILISNILWNFTIFTFCVFISIGLYLGINVIGEERKEFNIKNKIIDKIVKRVLPIIITCTGIYMLSEPIIDYSLKDYQKIYGTVDTITHSKGGDSLYVDDLELDLYGDLFNNIEEGKSYTFLYTKRTKIILDVK